MALGIISLTFALGLLCSVGLLVIRVSYMPMLQGTGTVQSTSVLSLKNLWL